MKTDTNENEISLEDARTEGFNFAIGIPECNRDMLEDGMDESEAKDLAFDAWHEAQDNKRQYSPFEFTAKALNDADNSEEAWAAFDQGISDAFEAGWKDILRHFTFSGV